MIWCFYEKIPRLFKTKIIRTNYSRTAVREQGFPQKPVRINGIRVPSSSTFTSVRSKQRECLHTKAFSWGYSEKRDTDRAVFLFSVNPFTKSEQE